MITAIVDRQSFLSYHGPPSPDRFHVGDEKHVALEIHSGLKSYISQNYDQDRYRLYGASYTIGYTEVHCYAAYMYFLHDSPSTNTPAHFYD